MSSSRPVALGPARGGLPGPLLLGALAWALLASAATRPAAAGSDEVITMRGSRVEVAALPTTPGVDALRGTRRGGPPDLHEDTLRVGQTGRNALRAQMRAMLRTYEEHLGLEVPPSALEALPLFGDPHALRGTPRPGVSRERFEQRELERARLAAACSLLRTALPGAPAWLEEGFAQYFEGIEVAGGATAVYAQPAPDGALRLALAQQRLLPLEDVVGRDAAGFSASVDGVLASAQAWSLVFFLMEQGESHEQMRGVLAELARSPESSLRSLARPFGTFGQLEREWRAFLGRSRRTHLLFLTDELRRSLEERDEPLVYERYVLLYPVYAYPFSGRPGFGKPGFGRPGFGRPWFGRRGFGKPGFGTDGLRPGKGKLRGKGKLGRRGKFRGKSGLRTRPGGNGGGVIVRRPG